MAPNSTKKRLQFRSLLHLSASKSTRYRSRTPNLTRNRSCDVQYAPFFKRLALNQVATMAQVANMPVPENLGNVYIVESSGRLLVVTQQLLGEGIIIREKAYRTYEFQVFEVDLSTNNWTKMKGLGNKTLFQGSNSSICIESDGDNFKPNRIFFKDVYMNANYVNKKGGYHIRVYNIEDRSIEPYFLGNSSSRLTPTYNFTTPPTWIEQCLY
ncbi:hypothetical protein QYF36_022731 [Acer negundo]|nr:hypothetical protein QYF36_022731 [Acer negundo]